MRFDHALDVSHGGFEWKHELVGFVLPRDYVEDAAHGGRRERHRDAFASVNRQQATALESSFSLNKIFFKLLVDRGGQRECGILIFILSGGCRDVVRAW